MTDDNWRSTPDDEPVIGLDDIDTVFARAGARNPVNRQTDARHFIPDRIPAFHGGPELADGLESEIDTYDDVVGLYDDEDEGEYEDFYAEQMPTRQPAFYAFLGLSVLVGALFVFFLIRVMGNNDSEGDPTAASGPSDIAVTVDAPKSGDRIEAGQDINVLVRASANEDIVRFELYRGVTAVDRVNASKPSGDGIYSAALKVRFDEKGDYSFVVRVITESGEEKNSSEVRVVVFESIDGTDRPSVRGRALALVTLRVGPGDNFGASGQLQPGEEFAILAKTTSADWLLIEKGGGLWVRSAAVEAFDSLALVAVREPTPTRAPATSTLPPSPSPSASPSPVSPTIPPNAPDFIPANAALADGGATLRVTVANTAPVEFRGPLVVSVADIGVGGTLAQVFNVTIPANGSVVVEFDISPPVSEPRTARITVDPDLAIAESSENNNSASFGLTPPVEKPALVIANVSVLDTSMQVTLRNDGGPLAPSPVTVRVTVGTSTTETQNPALALAKGQSSAPISVLKPGTGKATVQVLVNGQLVAEVSGVDLPAAGQ